jgi:hypothetical protein
MKDEPPPILSGVSGNAVNDIIEVVLSILIP